MSDLVRRQIKQAIQGDIAVDTEMLQAVLVEMERLESEVGELRAYVAEEHPFIERLHAVAQANGWKGGVDVLERAVDIVERHQGTK